MAKATWLQSNIRKMKNDGQPPASIDAFALPRGKTLQLFSLLRLVSAAVAHIETAVLQGGVLLAASRPPFLRWGVA